MSQRKKARDSHEQRDLDYYEKRKRTLLPKPGQVLKDDPAGQMGVNVLLVFLTAFYEMGRVIVVPLWALIRYLCYDAWKK